MTIPHSGEKVPDACTWLMGLSEPHLMCDVDRYVDRLYESVLTDLKISHVKTPWHRYAVDLNRTPEDVDAGTLEGADLPTGTHARGYHWSITTKGQVLMTKPVGRKLHGDLTALIYEPFHADVKGRYQEMRSLGFQNVYHLDLHSMPSVGTSMHRDPGELRAEVVISDCTGSSSDSRFVDLVISAYVRAGFKVALNWPYVGGKVSEVYGRPKQGQHVVQVELRRDLYMNEVTKEWIPEAAVIVQGKLARAISIIRHAKLD